MRYRYVAPDGETAEGYTLYGEHGDWLGHVTLEYNDREEWGRLMCVTDYGNYAYQWDGTGGDFPTFLLRNSNEYITGKMASGHDERRVLLPKASRPNIRTAFLKRGRGEDADWIGERLLELDACECEADFYAWAAETGLEDVYNHFEWGWGGYLRGLCKYLLPELKRVLAKGAQA